MHLYPEDTNVFSHPIRWCYQMTQLYIRMNMGKNFSISFHRVLPRPVNFAEIQRILKKHALNIAIPYHLKSWLPIKEVTVLVAYATWMAMVLLIAHGKILEMVTFLTSSRQ